uniref:STI1 domain-containing protein n=1 Tax=Oryza brachyantha TaxID=4533 RepID=J3LXP1_ORYBR
MVRGAGPPAGSAAPAAASPQASTTPSSAPTGGLGSLFPGLGGTGTAGTRPAGLLGSGFPELDQMQQQCQNPNLMREIMNMPMMQNLMNNPDLIRNMIMNNPQMGDIIDRNPGLAHVLNDPSVLRQTLEAARNPEIMREMMRNTDRGMSNIESSPEGFNMLRRMYETVQEPFLNATTMGGEGNTAANPFSALLGNQGSNQPRDPASNAPNTVSESTTGTPAPNTNPLPNPWSSNTGGAQGATRAGLGNARTGATGGLGETLQQVLSFQQTLLSQLGQNQPRQDGSQGGNATDIGKQVWSPSPEFALSRCGLMPCTNKQSAASKRRKEAEEEEECATVGFAPVKKMVSLPMGDVKWILAKKRETYTDPDTLPKSCRKAICRSNIICRVDDDRFFEFQNKVKAAIESDGCYMVDSDFVARRERCPKERCHTTNNSGDYTCADGKPSELWQCGCWSLEAPVVPAPSSAGKPKWKASIDFKWIWENTGTALCQQRSTSCYRSDSGANRFEYKLVALQATLPTKHSDILCLFVVIQNPKQEYEYATGEYFLRQFKGPPRIHVAHPEVLGPGPRRQSPSWPSPSGPRLLIKGHVAWKAPSVQRTATAFNALYHSRDAAFNAACQGHEGLSSHM